MSIARAVARSIARPIAKSLAGGAEGEATEPDAFLFVSFGESNSGGYSLNSDALSWEIGSRSELQFWNVNTDVFENMDIGTNNNLDHAGLDSTTHGWELGLANSIRQNKLGAKDCYYVQTGQGSSLIAQWAVGHGSNYWSEFLTRVSTAKTALVGVNYQSVVWISLGINDAIAGTPISNAAYKAGMEELIARIKAELPSCKIYIAKLPPVNGTYDGYSTQIIDIATADASVRAIDVTSPVELDYRDTNHWSYAGMKRLAARFVDAMRADFAFMVNRTLTWSVRGDAGYVYHSAINQHSHADESLDTTIDGSLVSEVSGTTTNQGIVIAMDSDIAEVNWSGGADTYFCAHYQFNGALFKSVSNGTADSGGESSPCWVRLRWAAANDNLLLETSTDGGSTWTLRHTYTDALAGVTTARVKSFSAVEGGFADAWTA